MSSSSSSSSGTSSGSSSSSSYRYQPGSSGLSSSDLARVAEAERELLPYLISAEATAIQDAKLETYFHMLPSKHAALVAMLISMVATVITLILPAFTQAWLFLLVPLTTLLMTLGYLFRLKMIYDPHHSYYVAMQLLIVVPPLLLAAVMYASLGGAMSAAWIPALFVMADIVCLIVQTIGVRDLTAASSSSSPTTKTKTTMKTQTQTRGLVILIAGMGLAMLVNVVFILTLISMAGILKERVAPILVTLLILAASLMLVRNVYRFQDFIYERVHLGDDNDDTTNEKLFYALDFGCIMAIVVILSIIQTIL